MHKTRSFRVNHHLSFTWRGQNAAFKCDTMFKDVNTGQLFDHYRVSGRFIVRETIMTGHKHNFVDSVSVFTHDGFVVGQVYRVRETIANSHDSTKPIVENILKTAAYTSIAKASVEIDIEQLYNTTEKTDADINLLFWSRVYPFIDQTQKRYM